MPKAIRESKAMLPALLRKRLAAGLRLCLLLCLASAAQAAPRSLRVDFGSSTWGDAGRCDPQQVTGNLLRMRGVFYSGYAPLVATHVYCQYASALRAEDLGSPEDAEIRKLFRPGETISASRFSFMDNADPFATGRKAFQWTLYQFADFAILGLYGPSSRSASGTEVALATDAATTYTLNRDFAYMNNQEPLGWGDPALYDCFMKYAFTQPGSDFEQVFDWFDVGKHYDVWLGYLCRDQARVPARRLLVALPDLNANAVADLAVIHRKGPFAAEIRDGAAGELIRNVGFFDAGYAAVDAARVPDSDGNGVDELAVLARRLGDGRGVVQLRNLVGTQSPRNLLFGAGQTPVALAIVADSDANGIPELAVLSVRDSDGRGFLELRNAFGTANRRVMALRAGTTPRRIATTADADGNGLPELAVLSTRDSDGRGLLELHDAGGVPAARALWLKPGRTALDIAVIGDADGDGAPEIAVLSTSNVAPRNLVEIRNVAGSGAARSIAFSGYTALGMRSVADADANGAAKLALLAVRDSDRRIVVELRDAIGGGPRKLLVYTREMDLDDLRPVTLAVLNDITGNGVAEIGVLMDGSWNLHVLSLDAHGGEDWRPPLDFGFGMP